MSLTLTIKDFSGPLDMLLFMVSKAKIDIKDIFMSEITDQYIRSVQEARELDMEEASAFVQMAATLLEIKSRSLLPKPQPLEDEEEPEALLIRQLEEYAMFKRLAEDMQGFEKAAAMMFEKLPEEYPLPPPTLELDGLTMEGLLAAFARVMARTPREEQDDAEDGGHRIMQEQYTVPECMVSILKRLRKGSLHFGALFERPPSRETVVSYFLALLELLRLGRLHAVQEGPYNEIYLQKGRAKGVGA